MTMKLVFEDDQIQLLFDYCSSFMQQVELKFNYEELNELYEQASR